MARVSDCIKRHRAAYAAYTAAVEANPHDTPDVMAASEAERAALGELFAAPVASFSDVTTKAAYLMDEVDEVGDYFSEGDEVVTSLLQSLRSPADGVPCSAAAMPADPMLDAVNGHRAWLAAYAAAPFGDGAAEDAWLAANPDPAGDQLHGDPPMPTSPAGALAAIRFVMEDEDHIQKPHAAILARALAFLEGSASA